MVLLFQLRKNDTAIEIDLDSSSWIGMLFFFSFFRLVCIPFQSCSTRRYYFDYAIDRMTTLQFLIIENKRLIPPLKSLA